MRNILFFLLYLMSFLWFGCINNSEPKTIKKEFIGINISNRIIQKLGSCDSTTINSYIFQDSLFLLFRIPSNACSSCYNRELSTIRDLFSNKRMPVVVTSFNNCRDLNVFGSNYSLNNKVLYNSVSLIDKLDKKAIPYYLLLDSTMTIKEVFITQKNNHLSTIDFLSKNLSPGVTKIKFDNDKINMKSLKQGNPQTATFRFTNTGKKPFIIYHIKTTCGCTKSQWPRKPISPNKQGEITVTYDAAKPGKFSKTITIFCNTAKGVEKLQINGIVTANKKGK